MAFLEHFLKATVDDPGYAIVIPLTLAVHGVMRDHQDYAKPRMFHREFDPDGLTIGAELNPLYVETLGDAVEAVFTGLAANPREKIEEGLAILSDNDLLEGLAVLCAYDRAEGELHRLLVQHGHPPEVVDSLPPLVQHSYDSRGLPAQSRLNPSAISVGRDRSGLTFTIYGMPIRQEELDGIDIADILSRLEQRPPESQA